MIRKFVKMDAQKEEIIPIIWAFETWPEWVPDVRKVHVLKKDESHALFDMTISNMMTVNTRLSLERVDADTIEFKQVNGWFKKFSGKWSVLNPPQGVGTTLSIDVELQVGLLVPLKLCYSKMGDFFDGFAHALDNRVKGTIVPPKTKAVEAEAKQPAKKILQIFQKKEGLEVWFLGKWYQLKTKGIRKNPF